MLFSPTYAKDNFFLQINEDMEYAEFNKYKEVMDKTIKWVNECVFNLREV